MKLSDLGVQEIISLKYLAVKFLLEIYDDDEYRYKDTVDIKIRDRIGERYSIKNYKSMKLSEVIRTISPDVNTIKEMLTSTYDYVVNKEFMIKDLKDEYWFNDGIVLIAKDFLLQYNMKSSFLTTSIFIMKKDVFVEKYKDKEMTVQKTMFAVDSNTGIEYAAVIV